MPQEAKRLRRTAAAHVRARTRAPFDWPFAILALILTAFGLVMVFSASTAYCYYHFNGDSYRYIRQQAGFAAAGIVVMFVASLFDYHLLHRFAWPLMAVTAVLLVVVLFMPEYNDAHRWITIPHLGTFQPSEIAKFAVILLFAHIISVNSQHMQTSLYGVAPFVCILLVLSGLMLAEPHLSGTLLILGIGVILMFVGGTRLIWFIGALGGIGAAVGAVFLLFPSLVDRANSRLAYWKDPWIDPLGKGHQTIQSLYAISSGGLFGLGIGNSRQKHMYVPEPANDFIFSILCEELGFVGAMIVILLFVALLARGIYIASRARDKFGALLVVGIVSQIMLQAILNIAVVTKTVPNTGIGLPFFSYGGTALLMLLGEVGIVLAVSRQSSIEKL